MRKLATMLAFLTGAAVGGASVWYILKEQYSEISEQEIASAKDAFHIREEKLLEEIASLKEQLTSESEEAEAPQTVLAASRNQEKGDLAEYARRVRPGKEYTQYSQTVVPKTPTHTVEAPYVIDPPEFGELDGYTLISLYYFDDGILSDDKGIIIDDPEEIVGDALEHLDEEDDAIYVRSDPKRCDYEILRDLRSYAEFRTTLPPKI